jgi:hypothetical protein
LNAWTMKRWLFALEDGAPPQLRFIEPPSCSPAWCGTAMVAELYREEFVNRGRSRFNRAISKQRHRKGQRT